MRSTPEELEQVERNKRAEEWKSFRKDNLITQRKLADLIEVSRRTIQQIEAGTISPHKSTLNQFLALRDKYRHNRM